MEGSSGSVVLQQPHTDVNMEMAEQRKQAQGQRMEMASDARKRTRHPFSGYTEILYRERTTPVVKMKYRGPPKPIPMSRSAVERDAVFGGANVRVRPDPNAEPPPPPEPPRPDVLPADIRQLRGFQQPVWDNNLQDYKYTTLTAEGREMIQRWERDYGREFRNHPDKIDKFAMWLLRNLEAAGPGNEVVVWNYLLGIGNFQEMGGEEDDDQ